jgi:hypothetical protein
MPEEFEGDLAGAVFWGADLRGSHFRDVDLTGARIGHAFVVDVEIDAVVDKLVVNGVDVTAYVNERDPWYPLRAMLTPTDAAGMRAAWAALEAEWDATVAAATALPDDELHRSVDGEWSFVETLRHLVFAIDKWCVAPILGGAFHPIGWSNTGSADFGWPGIDRALSPSTAETTAVWAGRVAQVRDHLATLGPAELTRSVDVLENGPHTVTACLHTVFEEAFWHLRYARRDLAELGAAP